MFEIWGLQWKLLFIIIIMFIIMIVIIIINNNYPGKIKRAICYLNFILI